MEPPTKRFRLERAAPLRIALRFAIRIARAGKRSDVVARLILRYGDTAISAGGLGIFFTREIADAFGHHEQSDRSWVVPVAECAAAGHVGETCELVRLFYMPGSWCLWRLAARFALLHGKANAAKALLLHLRFAGSSHPRRRDDGRHLLHGIHNSLHLFSPGELTSVIRAAPRSLFLGLSIPLIKHVAEVDKQDPADVFHKNLARYAASALSDPGDHHEFLLSFGPPDELFRLDLEGLVRIIRAAENTGLAVLESIRVLGRPKPWRTHAPPSSWLRGNAPKISTAAFAVLARNKDLRSFVPGLIKVAPHLTVCAIRLIPDLTTKPLEIFQSVVEAAECSAGVLDEFAEGGLCLGRDGLCADASRSNHTAAVLYAYAKVHGMEALAHRPGLGCGAFEACFASIAAGIGRTPQPLDIRAVEAAIASTEPQPPQPIYDAQIILPCKYDCCEATDPSTPREFIRSHSYLSHERQDDEDAAEKATGRVRYFLADRAVAWRFAQLNNHQTAAQFYAAAKEFGPPMRDDVRRICTDGPGSNIIAAERVWRMIYRYIFDWPRPPVRGIVFGR